MKTSAVPASSSRTMERNATLDALFSPNSIAILGASGRESNPFARPLQYLTQYGYEGAIYPINPSYKSLHGVPCYPDVASVPGSIDLALALIPAESIEAELPALAAAGTRVIVVFASGFGEVGETGLMRQDALVLKAEELGMRIVGPNCQGVLSVPSKTYGTFSASLEDGVMRPGGLSWVGQSGAVGGSILSLARESGMGIAHWLSTGNQADLDSLEIGLYLIEQHETTVLALYLESSVDESKFQELAIRAQELKKSLIVLRSGTSPAGARAATSHTGAIIGDDAAIQVVIQEHGVIEVEDIDELVRVAHAHTVMPRIEGDTVAIITTSGGAGSIAADAAHAVGLEVAELSGEAQTKLKELVPPFGATENPIDVTAQIFRASNVADFIEVCEQVADLEEVDSSLIVLTLVTGEIAVAMAKAIVELPLTKPLALVWSAARSQTVEARKILREHGLPVFDSTRQAAAVLHSLRKAAATEDISPRPREYNANKLRQAIHNMGHQTLNEATGGQVLRSAGISQPRSQLVKEPYEIEELISQLAPPFALKVQAPSIPHKTERGGVILDVESSDLVSATKRMFERFSTDDIDGVLISEMAPQGVDLIFGVTRAAISGLPMVTIGMGGTATEIYRDAITTFAPVSIQRATDMLNQLEAAPLLHGFRGSEPVDIAALVAAIERLSWVALDLGDVLEEFEVNPLRATPQGVLALDFLMTLKQKGRS